MFRYANPVLNLLAAFLMGTSISIPATAELSTHSGTDINAVFRTALKIGGIVHNDPGFSVRLPASVDSDTLFSEIQNKLQKADLDAWPVELPAPGVPFPYPSIWRHETGQIVLVAWVSPSDGEIMYCTSIGAHWIQSEELRQELMSEDGVAYRNRNQDRPPQLWLQGVFINLEKLDGFGHEERYVTAVNTGSAPLHFQSAHIDADNVTIQIPNGPVPPGAAIKIPLIFDASGIKNRVRLMKMTIESDAINPVFEATVRAPVVPVFVVEPYYHDLTELTTDDAPVELAYQVDFGGRYYGEILPPETLPPGLTFKSATRVRGNQHIAVLVLDPSRVVPESDGSFDLSANVRCDHPRYNSVRLGVSGSVKPAGTSIPK